TFDDTRHVYEAIRISTAAGLGEVAEGDVSHEPPAGLQLVEAMRMAAERDLVARQYTNRFHDVFHGTAQRIEIGVDQGWSLLASIVHAHLNQMAAEPDSLILRKCGPKVAEEASVRAVRVLESGLPGEQEYDEALADFDFWLRSDGHRRNPGTTA